MRRLLFAAAITVANANGKISDKEIAVFEKFFGERAFSDELNLEKLASDLPERIKQTKQLTTIAQRMQIIRDLCTVAKADNNQSVKELKAIKSIAHDLEVPEHFVVQAMSIEQGLD